MTNEQKIPSMKLIYDLSLRQFDFVDRAYESLTSRAAAMIGWTSIVLSIAMLVVKMAPNASSCWTVWFAVTVGGPAAAALVFAFLAHLPREVEQLPSPSTVYHHFALEPEETTALQLMVNIENAVQKNESVARKKRRLITVSIWCMVAVGAALAFWIVWAILQNI